MHRFGKVAIAAALPLAFGATAIRAQVLGIPVYHNPSGGTGLSAAADVGMPNSNGGKGTAWSLRGGVGNGPFSVTAIFGSRKPDGATSSITTFGGTVSFRVFGGGLVPVSIAPQVGVGYASQSGGKVLDIPISVGVGLNVPLFPIKPWIAPRVQMTRVSATGFSSVNGFSTGVSVGANFNFLLGLGVHAAVDVLSVDKKLTSTGSKTTVTTVGVGAHFNFRVPMM